MEEPPGLQAGSLWERYRSLLTVMLILATVGGATVFLLRRPEPVTITIIPPGPTATPAPSPAPGPIAVYVTGAVANPETIVSLPYGSRAIDAIEAAGGFAAGADRVRVNQANQADGALEFIGEDLIKHTPRNETLRIKLGNSFDIVGERKQTNFRADTTGKTLEESFEISVRNRKKEAATVVVREYLYRWSQWEITAKNHDYAKRDAQTVDFPLDIPADGEAKVTYTVRYRW